MKTLFVVPLIVAWVSCAAGAAEPRGQLAGAGTGTGEAAAVAGGIPAAETLSAQELAGARARVLATLTRHLDLLLKADGSVAELKGKSADGMTALAFQLAHEATGNPRYRVAALVLADRILGAMRATRC